MVLSFYWQTDLSFSFEGKKVSDTSLPGANIAKDRDLQTISVNIFGQMVTVLDLAGHISPCPVFITVGFLFIWFFSTL